MLRYDSESSRRGLGRQGIKTRFQSIFNFRKMYFLDLQVVFLWIFLTGGLTTARSVCFFTQQQRQEPPNQASLNISHTYSYINTSTSLIILTHSISLSPSQIVLRAPKARVCAMRHEQKKTRTLRKTQIIFLKK